MQAMMLAIDNITDSEVKELEDIISQLETGTEEANVLSDKKFHYNITLASKNMLIIDILQAVSEVMDHFIVDLRREILSIKESRIRLHEAHRLMIESLKNKDKDLGRDAIYKHFSVIDEKISNLAKIN
jgi:GntR family transcriptional repressor for pyruvate dehydrogenase complex